MQLWTKTHFWQIIPTAVIMVIVALILNKFIGKKATQDKNDSFSDSRRASCVERSR